MSQSLFLFALETLAHIAVGVAVGVGASYAWDALVFPLLGIPSRFPFPSLVGSCVVLVLERSRPLRRLFNRIKG